MWLKPLRYDIESRRFESQYGQPATGENSLIPQQLMTTFPKGRINEAKGEGLVLSTQNMVGLSHLLSYGH